LVNRGALRSPLFADEAGCRLFLRALRDALDRHPVDLLAWCVMPNHWHLLLRPQTAEALPRFVRWLTLAHSQRWQAVHDRRGQGTLYQGRYRSAAVENDDHLLTVLRYIERNPVRAGLIASAAAWPWSSARERLDGSGGWLAPLPVPLPAGWLACLDAPQTPAEVEAVRRSIRGQRRAVEAAALVS
jgi:putative transposase